MQEKIRDYVSENATFYMSKYTKMKEKNSKVSWNWPAFLVPYLWMAYRKMYVEAAVYFLAMKALSFVGDIAIVYGRYTNSLTFAVVILILDFVMMFVVAMFANYYYLNKLEKFANMEDSLTDGQVNSQRERYAGVNKTAVWIAIALSFAWTLILG